MVGDASNQEGQSASASLEVEPKVSESEQPPPVAALNAKGAKRRFFPRFGLRTLFVVAILFCLVSAWVGRNYVRMRDREAALEVLMQANAGVELDADDKIYMATKEDQEAEGLERRSLTLREQVGQALGWSPPRSVYRVYLEGDDPNDPRLASALPALVTFPELWQVELHGPAFDDRIIPAIQRVGGVGRLVLMETNVTGDGLGQLAPHVQLRSIYVYNPRSDEPLDGLASQKRLQSVAISLLDASLDRETVAALASLPELEMLSLSWQKTSGEAGLLLALEDAPVLRRLHLSVADDGSGVVDAGFDRLPALPQLEEIDLSGIPDEILATWTPSSSLKVATFHAPITEAAARAFSEAHRDCDVIYWRGANSVVQYGAGKLRH